MKKLISLVLVVCLVFGGSINAFGESLGEGESIIAELENSLDSVADSLSEIGEIAGDAEKVVAVTNTLTKITQIASLGSSFFGIINGSYNFLKILGVIKDEATSKIGNIYADLKVMDEKLTEMDGKLNNITSEMNKIQASQEFIARTQKAMALETNWRDFNYRYGEEGMDALISEFSGMIYNGLINWCSNDTSSARKTGGVDNTGITVLYKKVGTKYELVYSSENGIPSEMGEDDRYVTISASALPETFSYNSSTFDTDLKNALKTIINDAVKAGDGTKIIKSNFPELVTSVAESGNVPDYILEYVASDAVNTLIYRVSAGQVRKDAVFTRNVIRIFNNYCTHLRSSDDGIDAVIKTFFLTHAFEGQVKNDIKDFCNRMNVKTAEYGTFVLNVLGLSNTASNDEKLNAAKEMIASIEYIRDAKSNSITGRDYYCYITNTPLYFSNIDFKGSVNVTTEETSGNGKISYRGVKGETITPEITLAFDGQYTIGDVNMLLLVKTLNSNGINVTYDYLTTALNSSQNIINHGIIVTSYGAESNLPMDGNTGFSVYNVSGDYFKGMSRMTSIPSSAEKDYFVYHKKVSGSTYDYGTGEITPSKTLIGIAAYGESHWLWIKDEIALFENHGDAQHYSFAEMRHMHESGDYYKNYLSTTAKYNTILCVPLDPLPKLRRDNGYNPLESFENLVFESEEKNNTVEVILGEEKTEDTPLETNPETGAPAEGISLVFTVFSVMAVMAVKKIK